MSISQMILFSFSLYLGVYSHSLAPTRFLVTRVGPCVNSPKTVKISEMSMDREEYDITLSGQLNVTEDLENGWSIMATMQKCHDIRNLDTCDFFRSLPVLKGGCEDASDLLEMFTHYVTPKLSCPIKAGSYKVNQFPLILEDGELTATESKISTSVFGYTYHLEGFNRDEERLLCVEAYLKLLYIRVHDWLGAERSRTYSVARAPAVAKPAVPDVEQDADTDDDSQSQVNDPAPAEPTSDPAAPDAEDETKDTDDKSPASDPASAPDVNQETDDTDDDE